MRLVDSHAHLDAPAFSDDLSAVLARAEASGVHRILTIGCLGSQVGSERPVLELMNRLSGVFAAFGVHPHDACSWNRVVEGRLRSLLQYPNVLGVGEIGLDYYYDNSPREVQCQVFRSQIRIAREQNQPIIVHTRDAESDTWKILQEEFAEGSERSGILHCFSGSLKFAEAMIPRGFYISFGGMLTFKNADPIREVMRRIPESRILVETDCPYLAPHPRRGKRNEPAFVRYVAEEMARLRDLSLTRLAEITWCNFESVFKLGLQP